MRLRQLECFVRTCELGSMSRAAEALNIAQPALGLQIRNLEHDFGVTMLVRTSRGVSPTPGGEVLLDWARDVLARTQDVKAQLRVLAKADVPSLKLGLSPSATTMLVGPLLAAVGVRIPSFDLRIVEALSHQIVSGIEGETIDLGVVTGRGDRRGLVEAPLLDEQLFLVTAPGDGDGPIAFADVLARPLAMPGENDALRAIVEGAAHALDLPLTITYEISSIPALKDVAARGLAAAVLPYAGIRREIEAGLLVARPIAEPALSRTLVLVRREGRLPGGRERALETLIRDTLGVAIADGLAGGYRLL